MSTINIFQFIYLTEDHNPGTIQGLTLQIYRDDPYLSITSLYLKNKTFHTSTSILFSLAKVENFNVENLVWVWMVSGGNPVLGLVVITSPTSIRTPTTIVV